LRLGWLLLVRLTCFVAEPSEDSADASAVPGEANMESVAAAEHDERVDRDWDDARS
jgi:hypothetical protein